MRLILENEDGDHYMYFESESKFKRNERTRSHLTKLSPKEFRRNQANACENYVPRDSYVALKVEVA
jgi:hypothetical protein